MELTKLMVRRKGHARCGVKVMLAGIAMSLRKDVLWRKGVLQRS